MTLALGSSRMLYLMTDNTYRKLLKRVVVKPDVCGGEPCIQGTRINVAVILDSLAEGLSPKEVTKHSPPLTERDVRAAVAYAAEHHQSNA